MKPKYVLAGTGVALGLVGLLLIAATLSRRSSSQDLPVLFDVPAFSLTDTNGKPFGPDQLKGKVWVVDFIFTTCTGPCPILSGQMSSLHRRFGGDDRVAFVSVTVDPDHDTPEVLKAYADNLGADPKVWHFLTGPHPAINTLATTGFKLGNGGRPALHDTHFVLVDGQGRIRGYYTGTDPKDVDILAGDIRKLLEEKEGA
jgi:protein SCO1/2